MLLPVMGCQCVIRIFLRFGVTGLKVVTKGKIFFDVLGLFCKAVLSDSKRNSARIVLTSSQGSSFYKAS